MFDIGFWELLVIAVVLLLVMGPERLPEVARQAAFLVRKLRHSMFRLRSEMQSEIDSTPFRDLQQARQEVSDFQNDIKQFGRELAESAQETIDADRQAEPDSGETVVENKEPHTRQPPVTKPKPKSKSKSKSKSKTKAKTSRTGKKIASKKRTRKASAKSS
ncbi:MAG: twin-arginine translocase subunit TatB [Gammaproteobacteria bacterium]|nr:twin-arginine translocase subunit TatB [Gammaproteobacteria bacterium]